MMIFLSILYPHGPLDNGSFIFLGEGCFSRYPEYS